MLRLQLHISQAICNDLTDNLRHWSQNGPEVRKIETNRYTNDANEKMKSPVSNLGTQLNNHTNDEQRHSTVLFETMLIFPLYIVLLLYVSRVLVGIHVGLPALACLTSPQMLYTYHVSKIMKQTKLQLTYSY